MGPLQLPLWFMRNLFHCLYFNTDASFDLLGGYGKHSCFYVISAFFFKVCQRQLDHNLPLFKYLGGPSERLVKYQQLLKVRPLDGKFLGEEADLSECFS